MTKIWVATHRDCGEQYAASVDDPEHAKYVAKEVASWIQNGDADVARIEAEFVTLKCRCFMKPKPSKTKRPEPVAPENQGVLL